MGKLLSLGLGSTILCQDPVKSSLLAQAFGSLAYKCRVWVAEYNSFWKL